MLVAAASKSYEQREPIRNVRLIRVHDISNLDSVFELQSPGDAGDDGPFGVTV